MAKKVTTMTETSEDVDINKVREQIREELNNRYGGVAKFLKSEKGIEMGGMKVRTYLYETGPVNYEVISKLCKYLGIGELTRKVVVSRTYFYKLNKCTTTDKKPSEIA